MKKTLLFTAAVCCSISANALLSSTDLIGNDYTAEWGRLKVVGTQLCAENDAMIELRGWTTYSLNDADINSCLDAAHMQAMKTWGANIVRLACYPKNSEGKLDSLQNIDIQKYIAMASEQKMYVLLDWHHDAEVASEDPKDDLEVAKQFFTTNARWVKENGYSNVLYEICHETGNHSWSYIKEYAEEILPAIAEADPGAIVICPTRAWNQYPEEAANDPIDRSMYNLGLMYSVHVYTCSHMGDVAQRMRVAAANIPIFVSEWSATRFDAPSTMICSDEANHFLSYMKTDNEGKQLISWCYAAWGDKPIITSCLKNCSGTLSETNLTNNGKYIVPVMLGDGAVPIPPCECHYHNDIPMVAEDYGLLNIGNYGYGGEEVDYHDLNSSMYVDPSLRTDVKTGDAAIGTEAEHCNAGAISAGLEDKTKSYRYDDCVDISHSMAGLGADWGAPGDGFGTTGNKLHNLCYTEPGEWINYPINVQKKGYYTLHCLTNSKTNPKGSISFALVDEDGKTLSSNIIRSWTEHNNQDATPMTSFQLSPTPKCGLYPDGTQEPKAAEKGNLDNPETCWGWTACGGEHSDDLVVLFKEEGEQILRLYISPDVNESPGEFSNFLFTFKSDDIPEWEYSQGSAEYNTADMSVAVYPNPAEGAFTVATGGKAYVSIYTAAGTMVYDKSVDGDVVISNKFPAGVYTVKVANGKGVTTIKLVVK